MTQRRCLLSKTQAQIIYVISINSAGRKNIECIHSLCVLGQQSHPFFIVHKTFISCWRASEAEIYGMAAHIIKASGSSV